LFSSSIEQPGEGGPWLDSPGLSAIRRLNRLARDGGISRASGNVADPECKLDGKAMPALNSSCLAWGEYDSGTMHPASATDAPTRCAALRPINYDGLLNSDFARLAVGALLAQSEAGD